jgi:hypothetical protein
MLDKLKQRQKSAGDSLPTPPSDHLHQNAMRSGSGAEKV